MAVFLITFIMGTFVGSFLNVCIHRLPRNESIVAPGSKCYSCGTHVAWYDNIPVLSYLILRGRCRWCGASFSSGYLVIEVLIGLLSAAVVWLTLEHFQSGWCPAWVNVMPATPQLLQAVSAAMVLSLVYYLVVATLTDLRYMIIPDELTKSFQVVAPYLAALCGTNLQLYHLPPMAGDFGWFSPLPVSLRWLLDGEHQPHMRLLVEHVLPLVMVVSFLLILSLPLAKRVYTTWVPEAQRWKGNDYRDFALGVAWFSGTIALATVVMTLVALTRPFPESHISNLGLSVQLSQSILGALTGFVSLYAIGLLGTMLFRRSAMGFGDVKFIAPIGCFLGPLGVVMAFFVAAIIGTLVGVPMRLLKAQRELPFGPYLAAGALVVLVWGPHLYGFLKLHAAAS